MTNQLNEIQFPLGVWPYICSPCRDHYRVQNACTSPLSPPMEGTCGVRGCNNQAEHYLEIPPHHAERVLVVKLPL